MNWAPVWQAVWNALFGLIGGGVSALVLASWLGKVWSGRILAGDTARHQREIERLKSELTLELEHVKSGYSQQLEQFRSEMAERRDLVTAALHALSTGYSASHPRILKAMEAYWQAVLGQRRMISPYLRFGYELLGDEDPYIQGLVQKLLSKTSKVSFSEIFTDSLVNLDEHRPFLGETLWELHELYTLYAYKLGLKVASAKEKGPSLRWHLGNDGKPDPIFKDAEIYIGRDMFRQIVDQKASPTALLDALERRMIQEMHRWISGKELASSSLGQHTETQQALQRIRSFSDLVDD